MRVIAVLDLMRGAVVRGVAGERQTYRPIESRLTRETSPAGVAAALLDALPQRALYVADLDAIAGGEPNWAAYESIAALDVRLWVDAGAGDAARCRRLAEFGVAGGSLDYVVVGLESLAAPAALAAACSALGADRAVFSLDLKAGAPLCDAANWANKTAMEIADDAVAAGFRRMIVLDLSGVGMGQGVAAVELCRKLHQRHRDVELISGGGVRGLADLRALADAGCGAALVASALHDGRLTAADIEIAMGWEGSRGVGE
jgi:phosphoribosylformimino-5-aminoimidazole carboxamide ribotide isomerase